MAVENGDILKVTQAITLGDGSIAQNVYYLRAALAGSYGDATVVTAIADWMDDAYGEVSASLPNDFAHRLSQVDEVQFNATSGEWEVVRTLGYYTATFALSALADPLQNASSATAVFNTSRPKSRGRKAMFPFDEGSQGAGYLESAALTRMAAYAAEVLDGIVLAPLNTLVAGVIRAGVDTFLDFIVGSVTNVLGTQRTRKPGVGR